jgi:hypothetical protein
MLIKNFTTSPKVKLEDGTEEEHKAIDTKDMKEMKNLAQWILSLDKQNKVVRTARPVAGLAMI